MIQTTETLYGYTFTKKEEKPRTITAIFPLRTWRFVFSRTESIEVEVEAEDEEEARKLAEEEAKDASSFDW